MKEVKKIKLTDSPPAKEVKKYKLEPLNKNDFDFDNEKKQFYDSYDGIKNDLYKQGE